MTAERDDTERPSSEVSYLARIRELEDRLNESEETLAAIRRGDFDAVVVETDAGERQVYTLENADRPYRVLIEQIREGALTLDEDGKILYCNRRLAEMLGARQEKLIGQTLLPFIDPKGRPTYAAMLTEARNGAARGELCLSVDGEEVPANLSLSQLHRGEATPLVCGVLTDLTDQKLHLSQLSDANERLRREGQERERVEEALRQAQKMEAVGQLTGGVAHDFNNLLTVIKSSTELLRRPDLAEERRRRYVDAISDTVDRAAKLTGQLLAFARRQSLRPEVFDVCERLRITADMLSSIVGSRIQIRQDLPRQPCHVEADVSQFETALVNLAVNARDAMDGEGSLSLRVSDSPDLTSIEDQVTDRRRLVAISLTDTGCGIPKETAGRIFEPFFTTKEVGRGTGLGLSQVFGFAKQSGGTITVDSELGRGSTFTLYLPRVENVATAGVAVPRYRPTGPGGGRRVLVVEDNVDVGIFSTQLLQDLGYETLWASSAAEALRMLNDNDRTFDVVFSDIVMPGMNGIDLGREIRRLYPHLPIVLTSGYSDALAEDGRDGFELLHKPYALAELSRILDKVVSADVAAD